MALVDWPVINPDEIPSFRQHFTEWLDAIESGQETVLSLANKNKLPIESVLYSLSHTYWGYGEPENALRLLDDYLAKKFDPVLLMAKLRFLISLPEEHKEEIYKNVDELHNYFRKNGENTKKQTNDFDSAHANKKIINLGFLCTYTHVNIAIMGLAPLFASMNKAKFRIYLFSYNEPGNPLFKQFCDENVIILTKNPDEAAQIIKDRNIDILFDLNGLLREDFPLEVFRRKPAPVQAGWWNTPLSSGSPEFQYYFSDAYTIDPVDYQRFTEKVIQIPGSANMCYKLPYYPLVNLPYQTQKFFTFGCFTALFKMNDGVLRTWMRILKGAGNSVLYLKANYITMPRFKKRLKRITDEFGIGEDRILTEQFTPFDDMMNKYNHIDLCLNTFGYSAGTTTLNALWQGVPTLTYEGKMAPLRSCSTMMADTGLKEFIAPDRETYISRAINIAVNPQRLTDIRMPLRQHLLDKTTHFNPKRFAQNFEMACINAWKDYCSSQLSAERQKEVAVES